MEKQKAYFEHPGKAVETDARFSHVMAISLDPRSNYREGVIRCITSREGDVEIKGYVDRSQLYTVSRDSLDHFTVGDRLEIKNEKEILRKLTPEGWECIGLEDPDIWIDEKTELTHVYFTIPIKPPESKDKIRIHLGHAVGKDLHSLEMTEPVLLQNETMNANAKEVSIAPTNAKGVRYNLIESRDREPKGRHSTVRVAIAEDMGGPWKYGNTVFHPAEHDIPWIAGHASPGPLLPKSSIDVGEGKLLGIMNGREANQKLGDKIKYGMFSVGLFIYDYERGEIDWVSPEPFIRDSQAKTITFASQFVETGPGTGILYAHVDDSFVRAYTLYSDKIKDLLPE
ncbi:MAG: hypothetical protein NT108_01150 [Candidatus Kaiserbacteria bacterium]|nr:hypothetical protein [Candidatus Kaiserbacteria bacterium]